MCIYSSELLMQHTSVSVCVCAEKRYDCKYMEVVFMLTCFIFYKEHLLRIEVGFSCSYKSKTVGAVGW